MTMPLSLDSRLAGHRGRPARGRRPACGGTARRGYSLVELMIVVSMLSFVLLLCTTTLHALLRLDRGERSDLMESRALDRLAGLLRDDAHRATAARIERDAMQRERLVLTRTNHETLIYEWSPAADGSVSLERRATVGGAATAPAATAGSGKPAASASPAATAGSGKTTISATPAAAREAFLLKHSGAARFELEDAAAGAGNVSKTGRRALARMILTRREGLSMGPTSRVFEAVVGRDLDSPREASR